MPVHTSRASLIHRETILPDRLGWLRRLFSSPWDLNRNTSEKKISTPAKALAEAFSFLQNDT